MRKLELREYIIDAHILRQAATLKEDQGYEISRDEEPRIPYLRKISVTIFNPDTRQMEDVTNLFKPENEEQSFFKTMKDKVKGFGEGIYTGFQKAFETSSEIATNIDVCTNQQSTWPFEPERPLPITSFSQSDQIQMRILSQVTGRTVVMYRDGEKITTVNPDSMCTKPIEINHNTQTGRYHSLEDRFSLYGGHKSITDFAARDPSVGSLYGGSEGLRKSMTMFQEQQNPLAFVMSGEPMHDYSAPYFDEQGSWLPKSKGKLLLQNLWPSENFVKIGIEFTEDRINIFGKYGTGKVTEQVKEHVAKKDQSLAQHAAQASLKFLTVAEKHPHLVDLGFRGFEVTKDTSFAAAGGCGAGLIAGGVGCGPGALAAGGVAFRSSIRKQIISYGISSGVNAILPEKFYESVTETIQVAANGLRFAHPELNDKEAYALATVTSMYGIHKMFGGKGTSESVKLFNKYLSKGSKIAGVKGDYAKTIVTKSIKHSTSPAETLGHAALHAGKEKTKEEK